jgi:hypothetical protein
VGLAERCGFARDTSGKVAEDGVLSGESIEIAGAAVIELAGLDY